MLKAYKTPPYGGIPVQKPGHQRSKSHLSSPNNNKSAQRSVMQFKSMNGTIKEEENEEMAATFDNQKQQQKQLQAGDRGGSVGSSLYKQIQKELGQKPISENMHIPEAVQELLYEKDEEIQRLLIENERLKDRIQKLANALESVLAKNQNSLVSSTAQVVSTPGASLAPSEQEQSLLSGNAKALLKQKDRELQSYLQTINALERQVTLLKQRLDESDGHKRYSEMQAKCKESDQKVQELQKQLRFMEKIQIGQGKALEKITNENDYPAQVKQLREQLRVARDKNREMDERLRREEKNTIVAQERMVALEEKNRDLTNALRNKRPGAKDNEEDLYDLAMIPVNMDLQYKLQEAQRVNNILFKSKEVQAKTIEQLKNKLEKVADKYKAQINDLQNQLQDKGKEIKLYQMRLKEAYRGGGSVLASDDPDFDRNSSEVITYKPPQPHQIRSERVSPTHSIASKANGSEARMKVKSNLSRVIGLKNQIISKDYGQLPAVVVNRLNTSSTIQDSLKPFKDDDHSPSKGGARNASIVLLTEDLRTQNQRNELETVLQTSMHMLRVNTPMPHSKKPATSESQAARSSLMRIEVELNAAKIKEVDDDIFLKGGDISKLNEGLV